jgi:hypothetical protein
VIPRVEEALAIAQLRELIPDLAVESGKLEADARRCAQRGQLQLAGELRSIARRLTRIHEVVARARDMSDATGTTALTDEEGRGAGDSGAPPITGDVR